MSILHSILTHRASLAVFSAVSVCVAGASAQLNTGVPPELKGVDIIEHLDAKLPLDIVFTNEAGQPVRLGEYFKRERPVVLQIGYMKCPMLCGLVLNGAVDAFTELDWSIGNEYEVICISIDPSETADLARAKKEGYVAVYGRPGAAQGFHLLTGNAGASKAVADAVGFEYRRQEDGEFAHAAAIFVITPDGRIGRYIYGTKFDPAHLRMALLEASQGKIGTTLDRFILWCHMYDPNAGSYVVAAMRVMQIAGVVTLAVVGGGLLYFWRRERHQHHARHGSMTLGASHSGASI